MKISLHWLKTEERIKKDKLQKWKRTGWKSFRYVVLTLILASVFFIASLLFSPENYIVVITPGPPASLVNAGMG